ncbi:MAG: hypothetical protein ABI091_11875, partial [Ferruginibacter sp.]
FLSYHQGKKDAEMQKRIFINSLILHIIIAILIVISLEIIGLFLFNGFLKIAPDRVHAARAIYQFMAATVFFTIIEVPFTGTLNAHENILWLAIVSIFEVLLKLGIAIWISFPLNTDKLIFYGILNPFISVVSTILYATYCLVKYKECTLRIWKKAERALIKQLGFFAGWNLFGALCTLGKTQGLAVILNLFFGTIVNAAYGIANQIAAQLNFLSTALLQAINPQIMKSQGFGDTERMLRLSMIASKFSFFLMAMVAIPCIFEMEYVLKAWLKVVPDNTMIFCDLITISILINQLTIGLQSAMQAIGTIRIYQMVIGALILLNIPIAYILLKLGMPAYTAVLSFSIIETLACIFRLYFAKKIAGLNIREYVIKVFLKEIPPLVILIAFCFAFTHFFHFKNRFLITGVISLGIFTISIYYTALCTDEKLLINDILSGALKKLKKSTYLNK